MQTKNFVKKEPSQKRKTQSLYFLIDYAAAFKSIASNVNFDATV